MKEAKIAADRTYGPETLVATVRDKETFLLFLDALRSELRAAKSEDDWLNTHLDDYLEAMGGWVLDSRDPADGNPWKHAADLLLIARIYE